jgi:hypothetical protein
LRLAIEFGPARNLNPDFPGLASNGLRGLFGAVDFLDGKEVGRWVATDIELRKQEIFGT